MNKVYIALTGLAGSGKDTSAKYISNLTNNNIYALSNPVKLLSHTILNINEPIIRYIKESNNMYNMTNDIYTRLKYIYTETLGLSRYASFNSFYSYIYNQLTNQSTNKSINNPNKQINNPNNPLTTFEFNISPRKLYQIIGTEWGRNTDPYIWVNMAPIGCIISDIRFNNEARYFKDHNYIIIHITRNTEQIQSTNQLTNNPTIQIIHESEHGIDNKYINYTVHNDSTINDLKSALKTIIINELN